MIIRFHPEALKELSDAAAHYSEISKGLAHRLLFAVEHGRTQIAGFPCAWPPSPGDTRRYILPGFPYQIVYRVCGEEVQIIALAHHKRKARYWRRRLRDK